MKKKKVKSAGYGKRLFAAVLAAAVMFGAPVWSAVSASADDEGTESNPKLTVGIQGYDSSDAAAVQARKDLRVTVDLYKIADAMPMDGYDAYEWSTTEGYSALENDLRSALYPGAAADSGTGENQGGASNGAYRKLADGAARLALGITGTAQDGGGFSFGGKRAASYTVILDGNNGFKTSVFQTASGENVKPDKGIYLLVPHGTDLTEPEKYAVPVMEKDAGADGGIKVATVAYTGGMVYRYLPELVSIPAPNEERNGWVYDVEAWLKSEVSEQYVSLKIDKTTGMPDGEERLTGEDHFVYQIEATFQGKKVYSNVVELTLPEGQTGASVILENIVPAGSEIQVTEVYTGASYELAESGVNPVVIESAQADTKEDDGKVTVHNVASFTNIYTGADRGGGAVENRFFYQDGWKCDNSNPPKREPAGE